MYLWRAVDQEGKVLGVLVQSRRDKRGATNQPLTKIGTEEHKHTGFGKR